MRYKNILEAIGNTPLVELVNIKKNSNVKILCKMEGNNPGGSVKDRPAYHMIKKAEESGELTKDKIIIEPTSGNTGIALAMIGAAKGYRVRLYMPECVSVERKHLIEAFGAEVELTSATQNTDGAIRKAEEIVSDNPQSYYMPNQFANKNNILSHYETTGPEIWRDTDGNITHFVAGIGTSGTLMGTGKFLKEMNNSIKIVGVEPVKGHKIQGLKNMEESIVPKIFDPQFPDEIIIVDDDQVHNIARPLTTKEGLFVGMSGCAAIAGAIKVAERLSEGVVVVILPDRGDRYLSTSLFMSICAKCPP